MASHITRSTSRQVPETATGVAEFVSEDPHAWVALSAGVALVNRHHPDLDADCVATSARLLNTAAHTESIAVVAVCTAQMLASIGAVDTARQCCDCGATHVGKLPLLHARVCAIRAGLGTIGKSE